MDVVSQEVNKGATGSPHRRWASPLSPHRHIIIHNTVRLGRRGKDGCYGWCMMKWQPITSDPPVNYLALSTFPGSSHSQPAAAALALPIYTNIAEPMPTAIILGVVSSIAGMYTSYM